MGRLDVGEHVGLVYAVHRHHFAACDEDELVGVGMEALTRAGLSYEKGHGCGFTSYAWARIRWAMLDHLRRERRRAEITETRDPDDLSELVAEHPTDSHRDRLHLRAALDQLSPRLRFVVIAHHLHEHTLAEVGEWLGVSESRVCQLSSQAKRQMRALMAA